MTLPASGAISLNQIADEFGLARSTAFPTGFYGKGGAPGSGALSFADFYGRSSTPVSVFTPNGGTVADEEQGTASVTLTCNNPATWTYTQNGSQGTASLASGGSGTSITFNVSATGKVTVSTSFSVTGTSNGVSRNFTVNLTADGSVGG